MRRTCIDLAVAFCILMSWIPVLESRAADKTIASHLAAEGLADLEAQEYQKAIGAFSQALSMEPNNPGLLMGIGQAYLSAGKPKQALPFLQRSLTFFPREFDLRYTLAEAYQAIRDDLDALKTLEGTAPPAPMTAPWLFLKGFSLFRLGKYKNAEEIFTKLLTFPDMGAPAYFFLANCKFGENRFEEALPLYREAIRLGSVPDNKALNAYFYNYGLALYRLGKFASAAAQFQHSIEQYPADPLPRLFLARCDTRLGNVKKAMAQYESMTSEFPNFGPGYYELARLYAKQGDRKRADKLFQKDAAIRKTQSRQAQERLASMLKLGR